MRAWVLCALAVASALAARSYAGDGSAKPFPVDRTQIVKDGVFVVEGRRRIAAGVEITVQKGTKIVGQGDDAVIEVEGKLTIQGVYGELVVVEDATIEVEPKLGDLNIMMTAFRGKSKGIVTAEDRPVEGRIRITDATFDSRSSLTVTMTGSSTVDLRGTTYNSELSVKAVTAKGDKSSSVKLMVKSCRAGNRGSPAGIRAEGLATVEIRESEIGGASASFVDCESVAIDACYFFCKKIEFTEPVCGRFPSCHIKSCDLHCDEIALSAPEAKAAPEKMKIENCWFGGEASPKAIREKLIKDFDDDPKVGVVASVERPSAKPLQLNWTIDR